MAYLRIMPARTYFNWSSGKDSAMALYLLLQQEKYQVDRLLTTVNAHYDRVSMHGLKRDVLIAQTKSIGLPLDIVEVPEQPSMEDYNSLMRAKILGLVAEGYTHAAFGDIFLEDLKVYREQMLSELDIEAIFPIWKKDTKELYREFIAQGFRTVIVCLNNELLDESFLGRELSMELLDEFPVEIDPCGENGEFHTFCFDGPIFKYPINFKLGKKVFKNYTNPSDASKNIRFGFCDIVLE